MDSKSKADMFAETWQRKSALSPVVEDQYVARPQQVMQEFVAIRTRAVYKELHALDVNKSTGPDLIGARILKELAAVLALPIAILCRRILFESCWP